MMGMQEEKLTTRPGVLSWAPPLLCGLCCGEGLAQILSKPRVQPQKAEESTSASRPLGPLRLSDTSLPRLAQGRAECSLPGKEMWFWKAICKSTQTELQGTQAMHGRHKFWYLGAGQRTRQSDTDHEASPGTMSTRGGPRRFRSRPSLSIPRIKENKIALRRQALRPDGTPKCLHIKNVNENRLFHG